MIETKIMVGNEVRVIVGDIYISINLEFLPMRKPSDTMEQISIDTLNAKLDLIGSQIAHKVKKEIINELKDSQK